MVARQFDLQLCRVAGGHGHVDAVELMRTNAIDVDLPVVNPDRTSRIGVQAQELHVGKSAAHERDPPRPTSRFRPAPDDSHPHRLQRQPILRSGGPRQTGRNNRQQADEEPAHAAIGASRRARERKGQ